VTDKLFYFGGYQGTRIDVTPTSFFQFVPTPAMLAGDFTAFASPSCNGGRQIALRAPFVNNAVSPSQFSPAALNLAAKLPKPVNACGLTTFARKTARSEQLPIVRVDYQLTSSHSIFGRYQLAQLSGKGNADPNNVLVYSDSAIDNTMHTFVAGDTLLFGSNAVNSFRVTRLSSDIVRNPVPLFDASDLGARVYNGFVPHSTTLGVSGGFTIAGSGSDPYDIGTGSFQLVDDVSLVRGPHQIGVGINYNRSTLDAIAKGFAIGRWPGWVSPISYWVASRDSLKATRTRRVGRRTTLVCICRMPGGCPST
jgi:hypothetical protein